MKTILFAAAAMMLSASALAQDPSTLGENPATLVRADSGAVTVQGAKVTNESSTGAQTGDVVTVTDGQATLTFANGCSVTVHDTYTVPATAPLCRGAAPVAAGRGDGALVAAGIGALVLVGVAVGGGGGSDRPSSP